MCVVVKLLLNFCVLKRLITELGKSILVHKAIMLKRKNLCNLLHVT